jgi:hypothetical protein
VPAVKSTVEAGHGVYKGLWLSTDPGDGSTQVLIAAAGPEPSVVYEDFFAGQRFNNDVPSTHWVAAKGSGRGLDTRVPQERLQNVCAGRLRRGVRVRRRDRYADRLLRDRRE